MEEVYTITVWKYSRGNRYSWIDYVYHGIVCSARTKEEALDFIKETVKAKYENGYYVKGSNLYRIQKTKVIG